VGNGGIRQASRSLWWISSGFKVWMFSKEQLVRMLDSNLDVSRLADRNEWFVWEFVPKKHVVGFVYFDSFGTARYHQ